MSEQAILRRLKTVDRLRELCLSLMRAKKVSDEKARLGKKPVVSKTDKNERLLSKEFN